MSKLPRLLAAGALVAGGAALTTLAGVIAVAGVLTASAGGEPPSDLQRLPVRVHVMRSSLRQLGAADVVEAAEVRDRLAQINVAFAPAGVEWVLEDLVVEAPDNDQPFRNALRGEGRTNAALAALAGPRRLAPHGWDLYVVRELGELDIGGAYLCGVQAAFVAARGGGDRPLANRKWAHELGHSLGLGHTPCTPENSDRLMMSGSCRHATAGRVGLSEAEILRVRKHASSGQPSPCRK